MLSLDLFDSKFEKRLHEGAVDDAEYARLKKLGEKIDYLKQARAKTKDAEMQRAIDGRIKQYNDERTEILSVRGMKEAEQPAQSQTQQTKGIGDIQDPRQKMAKLAQQTKKGPLANVGAGLKAFIKGKPEPMGEQQEVNPRALGVANFQRLVKANMGNIPTVSLEFIRPEENFKLDQKGLDLISDYYDGLENDQAKNYFIYRVLPSGDETLKVLKQLGWTPQQVQPSLPGIPTQGELPLQEKKKSDGNDLDAGDVKVARELQKLRAQYPAARSDIEAVARAEIDSTERSQQQLSAIRGANEKQDALLKQLVALDQEQGREINNLDKENDSLEKQLDQVQSTNAGLAQTVNQMTGAKKSTRGKTAEPGRVQTRVIDIIPNAPADAKSKLTAVPDTQQEPVIAPKATGTSPAVAAMARQLGGFSNVVPLKTMRPEPEPESAPVSMRKAAESKIKEHGGGIGPKQHWQDLMQETVTDVRPLWAKAYHKLAPKIERHRDSFLAGQLYDELENIAELHGAEGEFKRMMSTARNRAHMEYDTNPGGFQNWFWFLPFEDNNIAEGTDNIKKRMSKLEALALAANRAGDDAKCKMYQQKIQSLKQKLSQSMAEGWSDQGNPTAYSVYIDGREWKGNFSYEQARAVAEKVQANLRRQGRKQTVTIAPSKTKKVQESDEQLLEGIKDAAGATAVIACLLTGGSLSGCATAPQQTSAQQVLKTGQDIGRTVQTAKKITRAGTEEEVRQELRNILRGISGRPEELNHSNIIRIWKRIKGQPPVSPEPEAPEYGPGEPVRRPATEAKEIKTRDDFLDARAALLRKMEIDPNPANKQIIKAEIRKLENQAEQEGWLSIQQRLVRENSDSGEAVEMAIMRRMLVAHTDLIVEFGLDKVVDAIEEVAYDVGDIDEIGSSDVSGWVRQVKQILGAVA